MFLFLTSSRLPFPSLCIQPIIDEHVKYVNRNVDLLSMFKALNKCFQWKCTVLLYTTFKADINLWNFDIEIFPDCQYGSLYVTLCFVLCRFHFGVLTFYFRILGFLFMCSVFILNGTIHEIQTRYRKKGENEVVSILMHSLYM